ncbi:MAG: hypothetical protein R2748_23560 [Bryobacterales bacterium]
MIAPNGVVNAASYRPMDFPGARLSPGGLVSIFGSGLGPQAGVQAGQFPLPTELGPQRTRVMLNDADHCRLLYVQENQINCQIPEPLGGDQLRLRVMTDLGQSEEIVVPFGPHGFGFFTSQGSGRGPLLAHNFVNDPDPRMRYQLNGADRPAGPNQVMVFWGTGLGITNPPVQTGEPVMEQARAMNQARVYVGGVEAQMQYAGRAPGFAGLDQVQIVIPAGAPQGCAVPVRLHQDNFVSNIGTVAIGNGPGRCLDPVEPILSGLSHGSIVLGSGMGRLGPGQLGPQAGLGGPYPQTPSPFNPPANGRGMGGGVHRGMGGVGAGGIGQYGVSPGVPPFAGGVNAMNMNGGMGQGPMGGTPANPGPNVVTARFVRLAEDASVDIGIPPAATDSCNAYPVGPNETPDLFRGTVQRLDAGALTIGGPGVAMTLTPTLTANGPLYVAALPAALSAGDWSAAGAGGIDVGPFGTVMVNVPQLVTMTTDLSAGTTVSRAAGMTLNWTGGTADDIVVIHGRVYAVPANVVRPIQNPLQYRSHAFVCTVTASNGSFAIPSYVLQNLPDGMLQLNVTHMPGAAGVARFEATGLDLGGVMRWIDTTTYLDLEVVP